MTTVPLGRVPGPAPYPLCEPVSLLRPGQPPRDLAARLFRALYSQFELRAFGDLHVAVPKGPPWYAGRHLAEIACQINGVPFPVPDGDMGNQAKTR